MPMRRTPPDPRPAPDKRKCSLCKRPRRGPNRCVGSLVPIKKGFACIGCITYAVNKVARAVREVRVEARLPPYVKGV